LVNRGFLLRRHLRKEVAISILTMQLPLSGCPGKSRVRRRFLSGALDPMSAFVLHHYGDMKACRERLVLGRLAGSIGRWQTAPPFPQRSPQK